jgi:hypothetical protein
MAGKSGPRGGARELRPIDYRRRKSILAELLDAHGVKTRPRRMIYLDYQGDDPARA